MKIGISNKIISEINLDGWVIEDKIDTEIDSAYNHANQSKLFIYLDMSISAWDRLLDYAESQCELLVGEADYSDPYWMTEFYPYVMALKRSIAKIERIIIE